MPITFPGEIYAPTKPDLEFIESFDNTPIGGVEKYGTIDTGTVSITEVVLKSGDTMTGKLNLVASSSSAASTKIPSGAAPSSPLEGDIYNDSTQKTLIGYIDGIKQSLSGGLYVKTGDTTVANTSSETAISGSGVGTLTLPTNFFTVGKTIRIRAMGFLSDTGTPNLTITVKFGTTVIVTTGVVALAGTISNNLWFCEADINCRTTGSSGTVMGQGYFAYDESTHAGTKLGMVATSAVTVNTTTTQAVSLTATWGTADAGNTITCTNLTLEVIY